jgi:hypothetical protein
LQFSRPPHVWKYVVGSSSRLKLHKRRLEFKYSMSHWQNQAENCAGFNRIKEVVCILTSHHSQCCNWITAYGRFTD